MCDLWRTGERGNELPAERWIAILDELHSWTRDIRLRFIGGEVLLKPGVYDIIARAVHLGFIVNLASNGLALQSERNYRDLMNTGLRSLTFSLDGRDPAIHDRNRGIPGLHKVVAEAIRRIKRERPGMIISLVCIIMRETAPQLAEYSDWAAELGVDRIFFQPLAQSPGSPEKQADWYRESNLIVRDIEPLERSMNAVNRIRRGSAQIDLRLNSLREMKEYFARPESFQITRSHCMLGQTDLQIDPSGVLYMCDVKHTAFGHVDDDSIRQTWRTGRARAVRREIMECRRSCSSLCSRPPRLWERASTFLRYARSGKL
jgi:MoaA/NifB/PqqE/SkfB family radical SAM enzyme